jgi:hypothetical protein
LVPNSDILAELKFAYSITPSARANSGGGMVNPSALAVFKLMISSTLVDRPAADLRRAQCFTPIPLAEFGPAQSEKCSDTTEGGSKKKGIVRDILRPSGVLLAAIGPYRLDGDGQCAR